MSITYGQRSAKEQPCTAEPFEEGPAAPGSAVRSGTAAQCCDGFGRGTELIRSWVYGCFGSRTTNSTSPASATDPRYNTMTLSLIWKAVVRSCVMYTIDIP